MTSVRERLAGRTVPPVLAALAILAVIGAVVIVQLGANQQRAHTIPLVKSVTICTSPPTEAPCTARGGTRATFGRTQASELAQAINALPNHAANAGGCPLGGSPVYELTFTTAGRPVVVTFQAQGCPTAITFTAVGQDWGTQRFDWNGVITALVTSDLRSTASHP
jgi:hypothetical protein